MARNKQPDFSIGKQDFYFPDSFRLGDPVLIEEVTGKDFTEFAEMLDDPHRRKSPVVLAGLVAVAVWQAHPTWRRDRVRRFIEETAQESLEFSQADEPEESEENPPKAA